MELKVLDTQISETHSLTGGDERYKGKGQGRGLESRNGWKCRVLRCLEEEKVSQGCSGLWLEPVSKAESSRNGSQLKRGQTV